MHCFSQGDLSDTKPANRSSRRTRNSGSAGDEVNVESVKDVPSKDKAKETVDKVEASEPEAEEKKAEERMDVDTDINEKQTNGEKEKEKIDEEPSKKGNVESHNGPLTFKDNMYIYSKWK